MRIGFTEILVILAVALIVLGPDKLPVYMRKLGQALGEFKKYSSETVRLSVLYIGIWRTNAFPQGKVPQFAIWGR